MTSSYGAISGSWVLCQSDASTAWISDDTSSGGTVPSGGGGGGIYQIAAVTSSGGTFQADLICNYLGFSSVTAYGRTCGTVCGYCSNGGEGCGTTSTAGYYFDGGGGSVSSLSDTVHWVFGDPI